MDTLILQLLCFIIEINNFRRDLSDISAENASLVSTTTLSEHGHHSCVATLHI